MRKNFRTIIITSALISAMALSACTTSKNSAENTASSSSKATTSSGEKTQTAEAVTVSYTDRDLLQTADTSEAVTVELKSGEDYTITEEGTYILSGSYTETMIIVAADDKAKVQLVLDGLEITNTSKPAIFVKNADKTFVTTTGKESTLKVTGTFSATGDDKTDAVIYSKDDIVLNGTGTLNITSTKGNGITGKDDMKITGGTYNITCSLDAIEVKDSLGICDGTFKIETSKDGIHCEDSDDNTKGSVAISGGTFEISAGSDGIQAMTALVIDDGTVNISKCKEGLEATYVEINGGSVSINASDDGINTSSKSKSLDIAIVINGGKLIVNMGQGDTDALDSNGNLYINGGTVDITAQSPFDWDGESELSDKATVTVNGSTVTELTNQFGGGGGGRGGMRQPGNDQMRGKMKGNRSQDGIDSQDSDGQNAPQFDGQTPPQFDGQNPPQLPDGQTPPQFDGQNMPNFNGQMPQFGKSDEDKSTTDEDKTKTGEDKTKTDENKTGGDKTTGRRTKPNIKNFGFNKDSDSSKSDTNKDPDTKTDSDAKKNSDAKSGSDTKKDSDPKKDSTSGSRSNKNSLEGIAV